MHYYPKNIGDYRRDTMHLSLLEHGVYMTLIDHYILNEEPFSDNIEDILWLVGARTEEEKNAVSLILNKFFKKKDDGYYHKRCDEEIAHYQLRADTARENGKKGGRPKVVKFVTVPGKCYAISDDERQDNPSLYNKNVYANKLFKIGIICGISFDNFASSFDLST